MPYAIRAGPTFLWMILNPNIPSLTPKLFFGKANFFMDGGHQISISQA
jgi:hypothetical protein